MKIEVNSKETTAKTPPQTSGSKPRKPKAENTKTTKPTPTRGMERTTKKSRKKASRKAAKKKNKTPKQPIADHSKPEPSKTSSDPTPQPITSEIAPEPASEPAPQKTEAPENEADTPTPVTIDNEATPEPSPEPKPAPSPIPASPQKQPVPKPSPTPAAKAIQINISLPTLPKIPLSSRLRPKVPQVSRRNMAAGIVLGAISLTLLQRLQLLPWQNADGSTSLVSEVIESTPEHPTLLPANKDIQDLGGWKRVSPQGTEPVHAYADRIGEVQITVSEQPLPPDFKNNTTKLDELAKNFNATEKVTAGDTTLYIGSSANGPQSVILTKKDLLILIKSAGAITKEQWVEYVGSLK